MRTIIKYKIKIFKKKIKLVISTQIAFIPGKTELAS